MKRADLITVLGVVLAGGKSRRMGGEDKAFIELGGKPLIAHAIAKALPQVDRLVINANEAQERFDGFVLPVVEDVLPDHAGPLAGILSAMLWAREYTREAVWVASFPTDPTSVVVQVSRTPRGRGDGARCLGWQPGSKTSMMIMTVPQQGHWHPRCHIRDAYRLSLIC